MPKFILTFFSLIAALLTLALLSLPDRNLHVIFCNVGQGDAILVAYGTTQMLVDGGPDNSVLSCLGAHMPFWDRRIEAVVITHPQTDHFVGFVDVVRRYSVGFFLHPNVEGTAEGWKVLKSELENRKIDKRNLVADDRLRLNKLSFDILNPPHNLQSKELNDFSIVGNLSFQDFDVLLTGDVSPQMIELFSDHVKPVEVLKVPHHGSKNGLTQELFEKSQAQLAVISVGKNNRYGHPHSEVIKLLGDQGIRVVRTDLNGEVEVVSDGKKWWTKISD